MSACKLKIPVEYWITYTFSADIGVIQTWLENNCRESPREMAAILSEITKNGVFRTAGGVLE